MKLLNKKTGAIKEIEPFVIGGYRSLAELNEEWEDYEDTNDKNYWYIDDLGKVNFSSEILDEVNDTPNNILIHKQIGNYFESKEEAEQAVEKLKAWKRLKDKGFMFYDWYKPDGCEPFILIETNVTKNDVCEWGKYKDLNILFGGEDETD